MKIEEFNTVEKLEIVSTVWVAGKLCKAGDIVEVKGNDKIQLLASKKAVKVIAKTKEEAKK
jgi:hypothetical protein